jgi:hypothetical protein
MSFLKHHFEIAVFGGMGFAVTSLKRRHSTIFWKCFFMFLRNSQNGFTKISISLLQEMFFI